MKAWLLTDVPMPKGMMLGLFAEMIGLGAAFLWAPMFSLVFVGLVLGTWTWWCRR